MYLINRFQIQCALYVKNELNSPFLSQGCVEIVDVSNVTADALSDIKLYGEIVGVL